MVGLSFLRSAEQLTNELRRYKVTVRPPNIKHRRYGFNLPADFERQQNSATADDPYLHALRDFSCLAVVNQRNVLVLRRVTNDCSFTRPQPQSIGSVKRRNVGLSNDMNTSAEQCICNNRCPGRMRVCQAFVQHGLGDR